MSELEKGLEMPLPDDESGSQRGAGGKWDNLDLYGQTLWRL